MSHFAATEIALRRQIIHIRKQIDHPRNTEPEALRLELEELVAEMMECTTFLRNLEAMEAMEDWAAAK